MSFTHDEPCILSKIENLFIQTLVIWLFPLIQSFPKFGRYETVFLLNFMTQNGNLQ